MFQIVSEDKNGLKSRVISPIKSYVISPTWCGFNTKEKFQPYFQSFYRMYQKSKIYLKVA